MKKRLLDLLRCPDCGQGALETLVYRHEANDTSVLEGEIRCGPCGSRFPIIDGVPRMLPAGLRPHLVPFHPDFFARHPHLAMADGGGADPAIARTFRGFSFQHVMLNNPERELERWRTNFLSSIPVGPEFFRGKLGADIGCGSGRHAYWAHEFGAELVCLDLSEGVEVARTTLADCPRAHVVQGDIYHLPLPPRALDFAYSLGVIHHLPDPRGGFQGIVRCLKSGGRVFVWVYGLQGMRWWYRLSHLTWLRRITPHLPRGAQYAISVLIAALLELLIWLPSRAMSRLPGGASIVARIPLGDACRRPFVAKIRSVFDRVQPPVTTYHTAEELEGWLRGAGLTDVVVLNRDGRGWIATGTYGGPASSD